MRALTAVLALLSGFILCCEPGSATSIPTIAGITTIAVNSGTITKLFRHPKREGKKAGKALKDAVKGKN